MAVPSENAVRKILDDVAAPKPKVGGLFPVATVIDVSDPHALLGAQYETDSCGAASLWEHDCPAVYPALPCDEEQVGDLVLKTFRSLTLVTGDPITVYDGIDCNLLGGDPDRFVRRVRDSLLLKEQAAVERHMAVLLDTLDTGNAAVPETVADAIATAEAWLDANYAGLGLIHMSRTAVNTAAAAHLIVAGPDGTVATIQGTPIANGAGYAGLGATIYASGQVTLLRGPIVQNVTPSMNIDTNCVPPRALAERTYVPLVECGTRKIVVTPPTVP